MTDNPCIGADDPEERCPRHPKDCTCWQVDLNHPTVGAPTMTKETELPAVKVKDLVWELRGDGETYHAQSIVGRWTYWEGHYLPPEGYGGIKADDPAAAAQADYERRIISALTLKDDPGSEGETRAAALEEAAKMVEQMPRLRQVSTEHVKSNGPADYAAAIRALIPREG